MTKMQMIEVTCVGINPMMLDASSEVVTTSYNDLGTTQVKNLCIGKPVAFDIETKKLVTSVEDSDTVFLSKVKSLKAV